MRSSDSFGARICVVVLRVCPVVIRFSSQSLRSSDSFGARVCAVAICLEPEFAQ